MEATLANVSTGFILKTASVLTWTNAQTAFVKEDVVKTLKAVLIVGVHQGSICLMTNKSVLMRTSVDGLEFVQTANAPIWTEDSNVFVTRGLSYRQTDFHAKTWTSVRKIRSCACMGGVKIRKERTLVSANLDIPKKVDTVSMKMSAWQMNRLAVPMADV